MCVKGGGGEGDMGRAREPAGGGVCTHLGQSQRRAAAADRGTDDGHAYLTDREEGSDGGHQPDEVAVVHRVSLKAGRTVTVPLGSPSRGGNLTVHVLDIKQLSLPTLFYSVLVSLSVFGPFQLYFILKLSRQPSAFSLCSVPLALFLPY